MKYDEQGVPSVLGLSGYDLAALGLPLPVAIDKGVLKNIQSQNIQNIAFRTKPDGMYLYLNGNRLPGLAWDKQLLKNAAEAYAQMNPHESGHPDGQHAAADAGHAGYRHHDEVPAGSGCQRDPGSDAISVTRET